MSPFPSSLRNLWGERLLAGFSFCILLACGKNTNIAVRKKRGVNFSWINYTTWEHNEFLYMYLYAYIVCLFCFVFQKQETVPKPDNKSVHSLVCRELRLRFCLLGPLLVFPFQWFPQMNGNYSNKGQHKTKTSRISSVKIRDLFYSFTLLFCSIFM